MSNSETILTLEKLKSSLNNAAIDTDAARAYVRMVFFNETGVALPIGRNRGKVQKISKRLG